MSADLRHLRRLLPSLSALLRILRPSSIEWLSRLGTAMLSELPLLRTNCPHLLTLHNAQL
jgi:hypothetical protein